MFREERLVVGDGSTDQVGVGIEEGIHRRSVVSLYGGSDELSRHVVAVAVAELPVVEDVPRGLLEIRSEPAPLEDLGENVGRLLTCDVRPTQLGHGIVSELCEHSVVETLCLLQPDGRVGIVESPGNRTDAQIGFGYELVEEETPNGVRGPAVPGEQSSLHDLGEIDDPEHRPVDVGEEATEERPFLIRE